MRRIPGEETRPFLHVHAIQSGFAHAFGTPNAFLNEPREIVVAIYGIETNANALVTVSPATGEMTTVVLPTSRRLVTTFLDGVVSDRPLTDRELGVFEESGRALYSGPFLTTAVVLPALGASALIAWGLTLLLVPSLAAAAPATAAKEPTTAAKANADAQAKAKAEEEARRNAWETFEALERLETINPLEGFPSRTFERKGFKVSDPERWHTAEGGVWDWKAHTSSDEIIAHVFGSSVLYELVAETASEKQRIADFIRKHGAANASPLNGAAKPIKAVGCARAKSPSLTPYRPSNRQSAAAHLLSPATPR